MAMRAWVRVWETWVRKGELLMEADGRLHLGPVHASGSPLVLERTAPPQS
jgi:hypothetical protein